MLARDVTTSPSSPSAANARTSASWRARRRSGVMSGLEIPDQALESQPIALGAEPGHHPHRRVGQHRAAPLRLTREQVRQVYLDEGNADREQGIAHREAGMGVRRRTDDEAVGFPLETLDRVDQLARAVRLRPPDGP